MVLGERHVQDTSGVACGTSAAIRLVQQLWPHLFCVAELDGTTSGKGFLHT